MKPSDIDLRGMFIGTFDHSEAENTAAVIVKVLAMNGDTWRAATGEELAAGFEALTKDEGPWRQWFNNPFMRCDMQKLVECGFATWVKPNSIAFTEAGLKRMERWIIPPKPVAPPLRDVVEGEIPKP